MLAPPPSMPNLNLKVFAAFSGWRFGAATTYATMRGVSVTSVPNMGLLASNGNTYCSVLRRNIPFGTPMPATWVFDQSELAANIIAPSFRMRAV